MTSSGAPARPLRTGSAPTRARPELVEVLDLAARGLLIPTVRRYPLERAMDACTAMADSRAVIVPG